MPLRTPIFLSLLVWLCLPAFSQPVSETWQYVSSDNIRVYYQNDARVMAVRVAKYAERARAEIGRLYDFSPREEYTLYYFPDANQSAKAFIHYKENLAPGSLRVLLPEAVVVHPGTQAGLYREVKAALARLCLAELSGGNRFFPKLQSHSFLYRLPWYGEGITRYVGEGWSAEEEARLVQLLDQGMQAKNGENDPRRRYRQDELLDAALEGNRDVNALARKSVWHFVATEYGEEKLAEIIYLADISHSLSIGTVSVLGITLPTLTTRWKQFCLDLVEQNAEGRTQLEDWASVMQTVPIPEDHRLLGFAPSPDGSRYALALGKANKEYLYLWEKGEEFLQQAALLGRYGPRLDPGSKVSLYPIAWHKAGKKFVIPRYADEQQVLAYVDLESGEITEVPLQDDISRVLSLDWSHNGQLLVLSALYRDRSALFIGRPQSESFQLLSRDAADYQDPVFSYDDRWLYFASNRSIDTVTWELEKDWKAYSQSYDLWGLDREADTILRLTQTPWTNERYPHMPNSFELWYQTDETGILSVARKNLFLDTVNIMTDMSPGILDFHVNENRLTALSIGNEGLVLFEMPTSSLEPQVGVMVTGYRQAYLAEQRSLARKEAALARAEEALREEKVQPEQDSTKSRPETTATDSTKKKPAARYYIFDDDITPYEVSQTKKEKPARQTARPARQKPQFPNLASIKVSQPAAARNRWENTYAQLVIDRDPLAGYRFGLGARFEDRFRKQSLDLEMTPILGLYPNFKGGGGLASVRYTRHGKKLDYYLEAMGKTYAYRRLDIVSDSLQYRFTRWNAGAGVDLFPMRNVRLGLQGHFLHIDRTDLFNIDLQRPLGDRSDQLLHAGMDLEVDNQQFLLDYPVSGWFAHVSAQGWRSFAEDNPAIIRLEGDFRAHVNLPGNMVWTSRVTGGIGLGDLSQRFFIGGAEGLVVPPLMFNREDERSSQDNSLPIGLYENHFARVISPVRGFWFFARSGNKYVVMNHELRIPLRRLNRRALPERNIFGVSLVPFVDVGTAWTEGNPFSSRNKYPTETRVISNGPVTVELQTLKSPFVLGFGGGLHADILSYLVKFDVAWSVDDNTLQAPAVMISLGRHF